MKRIEVHNTISHFTNVKDKEDKVFSVNLCQYKGAPKTTECIKQPKPEQTASFSTLTCHLIMYDSVWPFNILILVHTCPSTMKSSNLYFPHCCFRPPSACVWLQGIMEASAGCLWLLIIITNKNICLVIIGIASLKCFSQVKYFHLFSFVAVKVCCLSCSSDFYNTK